MTAIHESIEIAAKPHVVPQPGGRVRISLPLSAKPTERWRRHLESRLGDTDEQWSVSDASLVATTTPDRVGLALDSADAAIRETNQSPDPVAAEIESWWDQRERGRRLGSNTTASHTGTAHESPQHHPSHDPSPSASSAPARASGSRAAANWSLALGVVSFFIGGFIGLVAIVAFAVAGWTLINGFAPESHRWKAWVGLILAGLSGWYYLVNYGYVTIS